MKNKTKLVFSLLFTTVLAACGSDNNASFLPRDTGAVPAIAPITANTTFTVTMLNNSNAQPLSPPALITHRLRNEVFQLARPSSVALEHLAEGGDNSMLITESQAKAGVDIAMSGAAGITPGAQGDYRFTVTDPSAFYLTVASMLTNTNDGFVAEEVDLRRIPVGESVIINMPAWDAGTELNTETAATIPGPASTAANKEGFNAARDDIANFVYTHRGVISDQDGLATSVLTGANRFLNPPVKLIVTRNN